MILGNFVWLLPLVGALIPRSFCILQLQHMALNMSLHFMSITVYKSQLTVGFCTVLNKLKKWMSSLISDFLSWAPITIYIVILKRKLERRVIRPFVKCAKRIKFKIFSLRTIKMIKLKQSCFNSCEALVLLVCLPCLRCEK